jgi:hypothetical protein
MNIRIKAQLLNALIAAPVVAIIYFFFAFIAKTGFHGWYPLPTIAFAIVLLPRFKVVKFQSGNKMILTWLLFKEPVATS